MKYRSWELSTLKEKLKYYKKLLSNTTDYHEQERLTTIIDSYEEHIEDITTIPQKKSSLEKRFKLDQEYIKKVEETLKIILEANELLENNNYPRNLFSINTSKEQILTTTKSFYNGIGGIFNDIYEDYYKTNAIYINFIPNYDNSQCGNIFRPRGIQEAFINIMLFNNPYDIATSIHEHSHAISSSIMEDHVDNDLLGEVDSIFFELLYTDSLSIKEYTKEQIKNLKEITIGIRNRLFNSIDIKNIIYTKNIRDIKTITKLTNNKYYLEEDEINSIIHSSLSIYIKYALSYLIAIELYYIYKRCESKALYTLEEIINIDEDEELIVLKVLQELGIYPGRNFKRFNKEYIKGTSK